MFCGERANEGKQELVVFPSKANFALASAIGLSKLDVYRGPVGDLKAIKNAGPSSSLPPFAAPLTHSSQSRSRDSGSATSAMA